MPFVGIALAAGVVAALISSMSSAKNVGDMAIGEGGSGVQISTKEGGIFKPSPNDQIAVAPNAVSNLKNLDYASGLGKMSVIPITGGIATSKAIDILVNEMKALRQDMNAGKIGVYMDGAKVTSGIAVSSEKSTRNNFNYGQRT